MMRETMPHRASLPESVWADATTQEILRNRDFPALFRLAHRHGISQGRIASAIGMTQSEVSRLVNPSASKGQRQITNIHLIERIADGFNLPDSARVLLGLAPRYEDEISYTRKTTPALTTDISNDEFLRRLRVSAGMDMELVHMLQMETENIRLLDRRFGGQSVTDKMNAHIAHIQTTLSHSLRASLRAPLAGVLADASALAGWQAVDTCILPQAWQQFERAKAAAREAADDALSAFATGEQGYVLLDLHRSHDAFLLVNEAYRNYHQRIPARLRSWLHAARAEMAAACHDEASCRSALEEAARTLPGDSPDPELPYLALDETHLARWRGNCLVQFGDLATVDDLRHALEKMGPSFTRAEASLRCDLAKALSANGETGEARMHINQASELARLTGSTRQRSRVERVSAAI